MTSQSASFYFDLVRIHLQSYICYIYMYIYIYMLDPPRHTFHTVDLACFEVKAFGAKRLIVIDDCLP